MAPAAAEYIVCSTGLTPEENTGAQGLVHELGMSWDDDLHVGVTHLLAKTVGSDKYKAAIAAGMVVVKPDWLVECSRAGSIVPTAAHELGILEGLCICTTGLYMEDREMVEQLCDEHRAVYQTDLIFGTTSHLLAEQAGGAKYDAAIAHGIPVVTLQWMAACVEAKALVDEDNYRVLADDDVTLDDGPSSSMKLSDELTQCIALLRDEPRGDFLDGCVLWLPGFSQDILLKMKWLVRFGMGTRYDAYNPSVTHIIADVLGNWRHYCDTNSSLEVVSPKWLIESCLAFECRPEAQFPVSTHVPIAPPPKVVRPPPAARPSPPPKATPPPVQKVDEAPKGLFAGILSLLLRTWPMDHKPACALKTAIAAAGGRTREINTTDPRILNANDLQRIAFIVVCHGAVLPDGMLASLKEAMPHAKLVTELWVHCCLEEKRFYPRRAHALFSLSSSATQSVFPTLPLDCFQSVVASISMYMDMERLVLATLLQLAGARVTPRLSQRNTHLLCSAPQGPKYEKARKWKLHIVQADWLVASMIHGRLMPVPDALPIKRRRDEATAVTPSSEIAPREITPGENDPKEDVAGSNALAQLDHFLGEESESLGFVAPRHKVSLAPPLKKQCSDPNFFDDTQAPLPNSEMVDYADPVSTRTFL
ncbi:hypothetical protein SPRG_02647 [Saprolegnia parasitica CBS 223.65]|uniref:BRCT domain-containing protein n=1 Tax=Saprolegnia parasitica (strain CBS 223.65) TaxID=695850 RepID=A0A067CQH2_SAPPC|nr:hypothetical protein SPRG_02647 [Saprolegnia parasitica CBS 223.65]KDO32954.1 hypothetical protein SPRG_02647 [Saprolegnia parasitica CBS 223.65]|eukprot:XP_012196601.1 hypothetical protein SPRG_02647 [Saprolegnia parasitica CBS 223.65]